MVVNRAFEGRKFDIQSSKQLVIKHEQEQFQNIAAIKSNIIFFEQVYYII